MKKENILNMLKEAWTEKNEQKYLTLIAAIETDIKEETAKSKGCKTKDINIIKRINKGSCSPGYNIYHFKDRDYYMFTNGFCACGANNNYGIDKSISSFDYSKIINEANFQGTILKIDLLDLKTFIKINPAKTQKPYIINYNGKEYAFNPRYLMDVLSFCNSSDIILSENALAPAFIRSDDFEKIGVVCPIRLKNKKRY